MRKQRLVLLIAVLTFVAPACGPAETSPPDETETTATETTSPAESTTTLSGEPAEPDEVTLLTNFFLLNGRDAPFYVGVDQGFFLEEGIDVTIELGRGSVDVAAQVGAGAAHFGVADFLAGVTAIAEGTPITYVSSHYQRHVGGMCSLAEDLTLTGFDDLDGINIGAPAGDAFMLLLPAFTDAEYEHVVVEPAGMLPGLLSDEFDAIPVAVYSLADREAGVMEQTGEELSCFFYADEGVGLLGLGIMVQNQILEGNPDLVERFVRAYAKAMAWSYANPEEAIEIFLEANPDLESFEVAMASFESTIPFVADAEVGTGEWFLIPPAKMEATVDFAKQLYEIESELDPQAMYTNAFVEALDPALRAGELP